MEAWKAFKMRRQWLTDDFCRPVYEIFMTEAVARGRISAPGFFADPIRRKAYLGSEWIGPSQGQLDPVKEVTASQMMIAEGLTTRETEAIKLGGSEFSGNVDRLRVENEALKEAREALSGAENGTTPAWETTWEMNRGAGENAEEKGTDEEGEEE